MSRKKQMSPTKTIINKALNLINSLDNPDPAIEKTWAIEAEKRLKAYKAGKLKTVSFEAMFPKHS